MKQNQRLDKLNLITKCIEQLTNARVKRFKPELKMINDRIDSLIERDFLKKESDKIIVYVA